MSESQVAEEQVADATTPKGAAKKKREKPSKAQRLAANIAPTQRVLDATTKWASTPTTLVEPAKLMRDPHGRPLQEAKVLQILSTAGRARPDGGVIGIVVDLLVRPPTPEDNAPEGVVGVIVAGHHRFEAAMRLGLPVVPVKLRPDWTPADVAEVAFITNEVAAQQTPFDDAVSMRRILDQAEGMTLETLALRYNRSVGYIQQRLKFLDVPRELGMVLGDGEHDLACIDVARSFLDKERLPAEWYEKVGAVVLKVAGEKVEHVGGVTAFRSASGLRSAVFAALTKEYGAFDVDGGGYSEYRQHSAWKQAKKEAAGFTFKPFPNEEHFFALDRAPFERAMELIAEEQQEERRRRAEAEASMSPAERKANDAARKKRAKERLDARVTDRAREMQVGALKKALAPVCGLEPKVIDSLLIMASERIHLHELAVDAVADICGLDVEDVRKALEVDWDSRGKQRAYSLYEAYKRLAKKDEAVAWRLVAGIVTYFLHEPDRARYGDARNEPVFKLWTGTTWEAVEKRARKEVMDEQRLREEGKLPKRPKATEDFRSVECPSCATPNGKGGHEGTDCIGPTGHKKRTPCAARLRLWEQTRSRAKPKDAEARPRRPAKASKGRRPGKKASRKKATDEEVGDDE